MKAFNVLLVIISLAIGITLPVSAGIYDITFDDGNGNVGSGQIDVESANNNFYASSGYLSVTSGGAAGDWTLYAAGGSTPYPGYIVSPSGAYIYNNSVYPTGNNPEYPNTSSLLDKYGLLFTQNNGNELNLWGNSDGSYTLGGNVGGYQNFNVIISIGGTTITPVPESSTIIACAFLLVPTGARVLRSIRTNSSPQQGHSALSR